MSVSSLHDSPSSDGSGIFTEEINYRDIRLAEVVGRGTFGTVKRGVWKGKAVAVKVIETEQERNAFHIELRQLSRVSHPNIIKLYGATVQPVALVMEYAEGGSLYNVLHSSSVHYTLSHAISWVLQCARGVSYLHSMRPKALIHRDLKSPNLLLINGGTQLKICDFGTACDIHTHMTNNKGSAAWMAPEVFDSSSYSEKCDVFSWGIVLWEVLARRKPFDELQGPAFRIMWAVHSGQRPPLLKNCPKVIESLMTKCWSNVPDERPSMIQIESKIASIFKYCGNNANDPILKGHDNDFGNECESSTFDPQIQTQIYAPQQTVTEPPMINMSGTNIMNTNDFIQSRMDPALSIPPNMSGLINSSYNPLIANKPQIIQKKAPARRSSEVNDSVMSVHHPPIPFRGHKRSSSSGAQIAIASGVSPSSSSQNLNKSRSSIAINDEISPVPFPQYSSSASAHYQNAMPLATNLTVNNRNNPKLHRYMSSDDFNAYLVLEPKLQPLQPEPSNPESMRIFYEHRSLSQNYLRMQMEVTLLMERKHELLKVHGINNALSIVLDDYCQLSSENESLVQLRNNLLEQREIIKRKQRQTEATNDGDWVLIDQNDST